MHGKLIFRNVVFLASYAIAMPCYSEILQVSPEKLNEMFAERDRNLTVVDVRGVNDFEKGHIDAAINVPLAAINIYDFSRKKTLVLYCGGADCSLSGKAAKILTDRGYKDVRVLTGGLPAWEKKGFIVVPPAHTAKEKPVKTPGVAARLSAAELFNALPDTYTVIDVRSNNEFSAGHIKGAFNFPLEELPGNIPDAVKEKKLVVYDRLPARSAKAAALLVENGFAVSELTGGLGIWAALDYPMEIGTRTVSK